MNLTSFSLRYPYTVTALALAVAALGLFAMFRTPTDLFPDTAPPQVLVITMEPGASARDVAHAITLRIEKEVNGISGLRRVTSTSRDEVSSVSAEFFYDKPIGEAVQDVQNAIARIRADLPAAAMEPRIYEITEATRPLVTLALSPQEGSLRSLSDIRWLAENEIADTLMAAPGIARVEIMGAHHPEIVVCASRDRLAAHGLGLGDVIAVLAQQNVTAPAGMIHSEAGEYLVKVAGEFMDLNEIRELPLIHSGRGQVCVSTVADVALEVQDARSAYHGNGRPAIALNVLRPDGAPTVSAIGGIKEMIPLLEARYPDIRFEITDDQQPLIDVNIRGMRWSLAQAILLTILVIFVFLADRRAALVVGVSLPMAFLSSLTVLWFSPYTLNMVTLSGLIVAVGMVVDSSVVVLENIYRHHRSGNDPDVRRTADAGASEVALAITAGMLTTVIVIVPVMFAGGYTQQVMRPMILVIATALISSLIVSLTLIPLLAARMLSGPEPARGSLERLASRVDGLMEGVSRFYVGLVRHALRHKSLTLILSVLFLVVSFRAVMPLVGRELMPPMDTGIAIVTFETPAHYDIAQVQDVLSAVEALIYAEPGVQMVSATVGSEPGQVSFGSGGATTQSATLTIHLVNRKQRKETIWDIMAEWRSGLQTLPGIKSFRVSEYGATPMATTRAPLDIRISGPDAGILSALADQVLERLDGVPGLLDVRRGWDMDKEEHRVVVDPEQARLHGTSPGAVADELLRAVKGVPVGFMRLEHMLDIPIRVRYGRADLRAPEDIRHVYVETASGPLPLRALADIEIARDQPAITREELRNTINITAVNRVHTIGQITDEVARRLESMDVPDGYAVDVGGTMNDMRDNMARMGQSLVIGLVLLYMLLMALFKSFRHPFTIMSAIPLAVAGGMWGLLLFDKPLCMPAIMGFIMLGGTVVNNSILMLDFIESARKRGMDLEAAILESVRLRIRPILMTTVSTVIGLSPLVFEMAVGLERMSPLGIVAATGLLFGTFLTLVVVPVVHAALDPTR